MDEAVGYLYEIANRYSQLAPMFAWLRRQPDMRGHTLLPNALSPILPGMAYGYHGDACIEARNRMMGIQEWNDAHRKIESDYAEYIKSEGNKVMWSGWNFWDPRERDEHQRKIQVVVAEDEEIYERITLLTTLLESGGRPILTTRDIYCPKGGERKIDVIARYAERLWNNIFQPSLTENMKKGRWTIVDYLHDKATQSSGDPSHSPSPLADAFTAVFGANGRSQNSDAEPWRFSCTKEASEALWSEVTEKLSENGSSTEKVDHLVSAMLRTTDLYEGGGAIPKAIIDATEDLQQAIGCNSRHAYVIMQHLALFERFFFSPIQYVFPIAFGKYAFVAFFSMKKEMRRAEMVAWRQIVANLFGALLAEHLTEVAARLQEADEQRKMLSHSLPKAIFKPMEYFTWKLGTPMRKSPTELVTARTLHLLTSRGQTILSQYTNAAGLAVEIGESTHLRGKTDLAGLLSEMEKKDASSGQSVFSAMCELAIVGFVDKTVKRNGKNRGLQEELLGSTSAGERVIDLAVWKHEETPYEVKGNRGVWAAHLWNLIENALRNIDFRKALECTSDRLPRIMTIQFQLKREKQACVILTLENDGKPLQEPFIDALNTLFCSKREAPQYKEAMEILHSTKMDEMRITGLGAESTGLGLPSFADFLRELWGHQRTDVGTVRCEKGKTIFVFYCPIADTPGGLQ